MEYFLFIEEVNPRKLQSHVIADGTDFHLSYVSTIPLTFCKVDGPYDGDRLHLSVPPPPHHPNYLR